MVSQRRKQENGIVVNVFNFMLLALLLAVFALPSGVYAQCKTVKASTMSICVPSGWKVEVREVMEYNISSMIIVGGGRTYQFMEIHASIDAESLDWFIAQIMKRPEEHFNDQALKLTFNNAKWDKVKETTFQSHDARQVSGHLSFNVDDDGIEMDANVTILLFYGGNEMTYVIQVFDKFEQIASLQNDEIVKSFRITNCPASVNSPASVGNDAKPCPGAATVTDIDGNTYNTVQIGKQCWMKENLRTTRYANGTSIPLGSTYSYTDSYRYYPDNNSVNVPSYGYLYNWKAVMGNSSSSTVNPSGVQGICPTGWHVPSDAEWTQLTDYVSSQSQYVCGVDNTYIAKALASTTGWGGCSNTCSVGNNPSSNNATGFSALPAGGYGGYYYSFGTLSDFWSATEGYNNDAYYHYFNAYVAMDVARDSHNKNQGFSVRCVRN